MTVIENWAPLDELWRRRPPNGWAAAHGLDGRTVLLYTGTLGLKHDPALLLALARAARPTARRPGRRHLRGARAGLAAGARRPRTRRRLGPAPVPALRGVRRGAGDAPTSLVAILEPEAGVFSVPSKVLSYHCAGVPILAAIPTREPRRPHHRADQAAASSSIRGDEARVHRGRADGLLAEPAEAMRSGRRARAYAAGTFDIVTIADRFERLLGRRVRPAHVH